MLKEGIKVKYIGASDDQVRWGNCDDPRGILQQGYEYIIEDMIIGSWHTKLILRGIEGKFNSVCFEELPPKEIIVPTMKRKYNGY